MLMHNILNKNLMNDNNKESSLEEKLNTITQLDEHDFLSSFLTQNIYDDILSCVTILLLYLPRKTLRYCRIFDDTSPLCVMSYLNIMLSSVM